MPSMEPTDQYPEQSKMSLNITLFNISESTPDIMTIQMIQRMMEYDETHRDKVNWSVVEAWFTATLKAKAKKDATNA